MSYSNFPNELDYPSNFSYLSDLTSDDWVKIKRYNSLIQQETRTEEENNEITQLLIELQNKHITAEDINKIIDCIRAIEKVLYPISKGNIEGNLNVKGNVDVSGNISGNGSKLTNVNADTLDGYNASDFAEVNHEHDNYLPLSGGTISGEESLQIDCFGLTGNGNNSITNFEYISAYKLEENGKLLEDKYLQITDAPTSLPANGGNADTVGNKTVEELQNYDNLTNKPDLNFASYKRFDSIDDMRESRYEGAFSLSGTYGTITGYSFCGDEELDMEPGANISWKCYMRFYMNTGNWYLATDYFDDESNRWRHEAVKSVEFKGHTHTKSEITNFPTSLPANGGNADTVGNKSADEFALADHTHDEYLEKDATISISQGGTGATTASSARSNLGLGTSATKGYTTAVTSGSTSLVTSGAVYNKLQDYLQTTGDGSGLTNVNAATLGGHSANYFQPAMFQTIDDLLNVSANTIYLCNDAKNAPHKYGLTTACVGICICTHTGDSALKFVTLVYIPTGDSNIFIANIGASSTSITWRKINDGGNAQTVNKATKTFTVQTGSWFRFAKCKNALASGVFVLAVNSNNGHSSISTFSVSQAYSLVDTEQTKITELSHSSFNSCVTKVRLDTKYGDNVEQYIDFYLEGGSDDTTGNVTVQFFGQGWEICDIESNNVITDYTTQEITL